MDIMVKIAEEKIREAIRNGEFDNLPGKGKPLQLEDLSRVPPELRASYIVLKNAGVLPEELQIKKEIINLQRLLECCMEENEKMEMRRNLNEKVMRFEMLMERRRISKPVLSSYRSKIHKKLGASRVHPLWE